MSKLDQILRIVSEDSVEAPSTSIIPSYPAQNANPPTNSEFTSLTDLIKYKNGMDVGETRNKVLGVPLQNILDELATFYVKGQDLRLRFKYAQTNPVYRDKEELKCVFDRIGQSLKTIETEIKNITCDLDNLALE